MTTLRAEAITDHASAQQQGHQSTFDSSKPWDKVWQMAASRDLESWWADQFKEEAVLIVAQAKASAAALEGDAQVWPSSASGYAAPVPHPVARMTRAPRPTVRKTKQDTGIASGLHKTNRSGYSLCPGFQDGTCTSASREGICAANPNLVHQCAKCLASAHGASFPKACDKTPTATKFQPGKGKGKKGRGKGKGKTQNWTWS